MLRTFNGPLKFVEKNNILFIFYRHGWRVCTCAVVCNILQEFIIIYTIYIVQNIKNLSTDDHKAQTNASSCCFQSIHSFSSHSWMKRQRETVVCSHMKPPQQTSSLPQNQPGIDAFSLLSLTTKLVLFPFFFFWVNFTHKEKQRFCLSVAIQKQRYAEVRLLVQFSVCLTDLFANNCTPYIKQWYCTH